MCNEPPFVLKFYFTYFGGVIENITFNVDEVIIGRYKEHNAPEK
jgi:hypothetical protein